jgi:multiple antibiotic resistance protein
MNCKPICMFCFIIPIFGIYISSTISNNGIVSYAETSCNDDDNNINTSVNIKDNKNNNNNICRSNIKFTNNNLNNPFSNATTVDDASFTKTFQPLSSFLDTSGINIVKAVITLFVVIDPIGIVPLFASFTQKMQNKERKAVSQTATITAGVLLFVFAIAGTQIFAIFGIDIFSFMIAGGVLLFIVSIELITHGAWRFGGDTHIDESGVVPLAFPLLAGPGAITAVIISYQTSGLIVTILSIAIVIAITYIILLLVNPIYRILGRRGSMVITRVFAVLVAAFAVQYIVEGTRQIYLTMI